MSANVWGSEQTKYFDTLGPDKVLDAMEDVDFVITGRVMQLASMENRVFEVEVDDVEVNTVSDNFRIIKFYRPGRWSKEQIQDEHDFLHDLIQNEIHAIAPININGRTIHTNSDGLFYTVFQKKGGRACDEWTETLLEQMGRLLARLHNTGLVRSAQHRLNLDIQTFGQSNLELILKSNFLPPEYKSNYEAVCKNIFTISAPLFTGIKTQRIHGDCHHGNILLNSGNPFLIDFDDMSVGPRVQDIWMISPGRDEYSINQRNILLSAYSEMADFNYNELKLIEVLRSLRIIHFSAWIGHRFEDESFKRAFPTYGSSQYWEREIFELKEQTGLIQDSLELGHQGY